MKSQKSNLLRTAIINCINAVAPLKYIDYNPYEAKENLLKAHHAISAYPGLEKLLNTVLKSSSTPDKNAVEVHKILSKCITRDLFGKAKENAILQIDKLLNEALEYLPN